MIHNPDYKIMPLFHDEYPRNGTTAWTAKWVFIASRLEMLADLHENFGQYRWGDAEFIYLKIICLFVKMFSVSSDVQRTLVKVPLQQRDLQCTSLNGCKQKCRKQLIRCYYGRRRRLDRLNTLINKINARSLTLLIFATGWAVYGWPQPGHKSMMSVLSFSLLSV